LALSLVLVPTVTCSANAQGPAAGPRLPELTLAITAQDSAHADTLRRRRGGAVELSEGYAVRLKVHQIASYLELPVFAAEVYVGQKLYNRQSSQDGSSLRSTHRALATGIGVLFTVNTVTGVWNLIEGWKDPEGRTKRTVHSVAMLLADAGFLMTAGTAPDDDFGERGGGGDGNASTHRALAIGSSGLATAATLMMWLWR
ncbi:MAG: hypothetical protein AB7L66_17460, partial [Gemmatimonadales bacterium]